ncbi:MAG: hypothetical protein AAF918_08490 [Pseudomonadota bacterium]
MKTISGNASGVARKAASFAEGLGARTPFERPVLSLLFAAHLSLAPLVSPAALAARAELPEDLFGIALEPSELRPELGATRDDAPALLLADAEDSTPKRKVGTNAAPTAWNGAPYWRYAYPTRLPQPLRGTAVTVDVADAPDTGPFWVQLRAPVDDCETLLPWLQQALARKYRIDDPQWINTNGHQRLQVGQILKIAMRCDQSLTLEYRISGRVDTAYNSYFEQQRRNARQRIEQDRKVITRIRRQQLATRWMRGSRTRVETLYGVNLAGGNVAFKNRIPDVAAPWEPDAEALPFAAETTLLTTDPDGAVIRLDSTIADLDGKHIRALERTLLSMFGEPYRRGRHTNRYRIGGQWLITRHRDGATTFVYLNQKLQDEREDRAEAREAARFAEETDGL